ncbi:hypothetical protein ACNKHO_05510 [Shigella flexneri]
MSIWPAPKSNAVYPAFKAAMSDTRERPDYDVPVHLRNAQTKLMKEIGLRAGVLATPMTTRRLRRREGFPAEMAQTRYYHPQTEVLKARLAKSSPGLPDGNSESTIKRYHYVNGCGNVGNISLWPQAVVTFSLLIR